MWVSCYCLSISDVYCWVDFLDIVVLLTDPTPIVYIHTTGMAHFRKLQKAQSNDFKKNPLYVSNKQVHHQEVISVPAAYSLSHARYVLAARHP